MDGKGMRMAWTERVHDAYIPELDVKMNSDDDGDEELGRPLVRNPVVFDADSNGADRRPPPKTMTPMPMLANSGPPDDEDMWAGLG